MAKIENLPAARKRMANGIFLLMRSNDDFNGIYKGKTVADLDEEDEQFILDLTNGVSDILIATRRLLLKGAE